MTTSIDFQFRLYSGLPVPDGPLEASELDLLAQPDAPGQSLDEVGETQALRELAEHPELLSLLLGRLGLAGAVCIDVEVTKPFLRGSLSGDIDLLAVPQSDPRLGMAIQAKRFKISHKEGDERVCLSECKLDKLVDQCNKTVELGFHQTYGLVVLMVDGRAHPAASLVHRGASEATFRRVYHFVRRRPMNPRVGLAFLEIVQPTMADVRRLGMVGIGVDRPACPMEQRGEFSEEVARWARSAVNAGKTNLVEWKTPTGEPVRVAAEDCIALRLVRQGGGQPACPKIAV